MMAHRALKSWGMILSGLLFVAATVAAQESELSTGLLGLNPLGSHPGGLHLYSTTFFAGYYSGGVPSGFGGISSGSYLGDSGLAGASTSIGWTKATTRTHVSIVYGFSYISQFSNPSLTGPTQALGFQATRQLGSRWSLSLVASAGTSTAQEALFAPTILGNVASAPGSFDSLSQVAASGSLSGTQIASLLTGAPILSSPSQTLLYGSRYFFSTAQTSLSYAFSSRLRFSANAGGGWTEHLEDKVRDAAYPYLIPRNTTLSAGLSVSYSLTPRTQASVSVTEMRSVSALVASYSTSASLSITRNMGRHWFLSGNIGAGKVRESRTTYSAPQGAQYTAGAGVGYKLFGSTLMASYQRQLGDAYGLGSQSTLSLTGAWSWRRPGSYWGIGVSGGQQRLQAAAIQTVNSWQASAGVSRRLNPHLSFQVSYGFGKYSQQPASAYNRTQNGVQASLVWTPRPVF